MARRALITGASRGIGYAIAERLAHDGWDLTLCARNTSTLDAAAAKLPATGATVHTVVADMSDHGSTSELVHRQLALADELDLLILAAGIGSGGPVADYPMKRLDLQYSVNFRAPFHLISRLLPALRAAARSKPDRGARIIALTSISGHVAEPGLAAYGATKAALIRLCETITAEEAENGVAATALSPGYVDTDMATWVHDTIAPDTMITAADIAELAVTLTRLSRWATVPELVVTRPGGNLRGA